MTFLQVIQSKDLRVVAAFTLYLSDILDYRWTEIEYALEKPRKFETEFANFWAEFSLDQSPF